ncbi:hypothetical protein ACFE04_027327 [Oxalis oulophora]
MPSRSLPPSPSPSPTTHLSTTAAASTATAAFSFCFLILLCFRTKKRTVPESSKPPHQYSYTVLRRATDSFSAANLLGQGGFGSVYRGTLPTNQKHVAIKVMDAGSLQGEREFQNEIFLASKLEPLNHNNIVSVVGFSSDRKRRRMLLVYELMVNGNLQDALLVKKRHELMEWKNRFSIAVDVARGIQYLHSLDVPVIHGDIKPSNVLLDACFTAKIADFGLSRLKEDQCEIPVVVTGVIIDDRQNSKVNGADLESNYGSVVEEESGFEELNLIPSPESFVKASPHQTIEVTAVPEGVQKGSSSSTAELNVGRKNREFVANNVKSNNKGVKDRQQKQETENPPVKDYVMEWLGTEVNRESTNWVAASTSSTKLSKKKKKRWDWWMSLDEEAKEKKISKKEKRRPAREWWKEEYCEELAKKQKKKRKKLQRMGISNDDDWWPRDDEMYLDKKKKSRSRRSNGSLGSIDWWLDGFSGELLRKHLNSHDSGGETPKSGVSSTPSMRGTVCYVAPEYSGAGDLSEKCDVYSYGVLLLVLIAGRRPLQVSGSPMSEFHRANLLSWTRHLARNGKLIELVDQNVKCLDKEQALLCITVALLCLQKSPARRPSMKQAVAMLAGELPAPQLPGELLPSTPSRLPYRSHKRVK